MRIPFTQYLLPDGRKRHIEFDPKDPEIEKKAEALLKAGYVFEAEILTTGQVHLDVSNEDGPIANEIVQNGPEVEDAIYRLVKDASEKLEERCR